MSPFRRCRVPTCTELVPLGLSPWCPPHAAAVAQRRRQARPDPFYRTAEWRRLRTAILTARPLCVDCGARATDLDHLLTLRARPDLALSPSNVAPRCHACHSRRTSREHSWNRGRA
jgi:5-methylcytosine-specific restriction protein A